jgi:hypothetical protein
MTGDRKAAAGINENWRASRRGGLCVCCRGAHWMPLELAPSWSEKTERTGALVSDERNSSFGQERNMHIYDVFQQMGHPR